MNRIRGGEADVKRVRPNTQAGVLHNTSGLVVLSDGSTVVQPLVTAGGFLQQFDNRCRISYE